MVTCTTQNLHRMCAYSLHNFPSVHLPRTLQKIKQISNTNVQPLSLDNLHQRVVITLVVKLRLKFLQWANGIKAVYENGSNLAINSTSGGIRPHATLNLLGFHILLHHYCLVCRLLLQYLSC
uniref:Uncharacterized protein n=1 Tax=Opuntia streptacantha TaxID=393608 RepID=A0A7C9EF91_OPUST